MRRASLLHERGSRLLRGKVRRACRESLKRDVRSSCGTRTTAWRFACSAAPEPALIESLLRASSGLPGANEWSDGGPAEAGVRRGAGDGAACGLEPARPPESERFPAHIWSR